MLFFLDPSFSSLNFIFQFYFFFWCLYSRSGASHTARAVLKIATSRTESERFSRVFYFLQTEKEYRRLSRWCGGGLTRKKVCLQRCDAITLSWMYISRRLYQSHLFFHLSSVASTSHLFPCVIPISSSATFNSVWLLPSSSFSIIFRYLFDSKFDLSCFLLLLLTFNSFDFHLFCLFFFKSTWLGSSFFRVLASLFSCYGITVTVSKW